MKVLLSSNVAVALLLLSVCDPALAQSEGFAFSQQGGEAIYKGVCQDCHMANARGAMGAGAYPALAGNSRLETVAYPVAVIIHGLRGMPAFGSGFTDQQIADVVNYVRTHFGNTYKDKATLKDAKAAR